MISMKQFVSVGGIKTVLDHAAAVEVLDVIIEPKNADILDVDIRFRFQTAETAPFFADLLDTGQADNNGDSSAPRKFVSMFSDEADTISNEVVSNRPHSYDYLTKSKSSADECLSAHGREKKDLEIAAQDEAIYIPDTMWIKRTQPISSILNERKAEKDGHVTPAIVMSTRDVVNEVEPRDTQAQDEEKTSEYSATRAANTAENGRPSVEDEELPKGCGFLRASSVKAAVKTPLRSFSRDTKSDEAVEHINATGSEVQGASANKITSRAEAQSEDEIQRNHVPPDVVPAAAINPDPPLPREDAQLNEQPRNLSGTRGNYLRKTSNLARNLFRKLGSGDVSEEPSRLGKRRPLFRKRRAGATADFNFKPNVGQFKNIKRPRLIFGRRYKE